MKKVTLVLVGLLVLVVIGLSIKGRKMQEIRTEIEIAASPETVWNILTDINQWQQWSPIINQSQGDAAVGAKLSITMAGKETGKDGPQYSPEIIEMNKPLIFRWRAHMMAGFIFTNDKVFELEPTENGTRLVHKEQFKGLLAPVFCGQMEKGVPPMLQSMNQALKDLAEKQAKQ